MRRSDSGRDECCLLSDTVMLMMMLMLMPSVGRATRRRSAACEVDEAANALLQRATCTSVER